MKQASAVIVAGGLGTRLGHQLPKAFVPLAGRPLFTYSLAQFDSFPAITEIVLVIPPRMQEDTEQILQDISPQKPVRLVFGGQQRWQSVSNGLASCASSAPLVLVHDAARPFVSHEIIRRLLAKADTYRCAVTATPEIDTVRRVDGDRSVETLDRTTLVRIGTPQLFEKQLLTQALQTATSLKSPPTDEAMLMEHLGIDVGIADGDPLNFKVTTPVDMRIAHALLSSS